MGHYPNPTQFTSKTKNVKLPNGVFCHPKFTLQEKFSNPK